MDYFVNVFADVIPGDSPYQKTIVAAYRVQADSEQKAAERAKQELIKTNRPIDTMKIKAYAVYLAELMPVLYA